MGDLKVKYCPTGKMLADHFTQLLQGTAFRKFRVEIQGIPEDTPDTDLGWYRPENTFIPSPQECVERSDVKADKRTNESREGSSVECSKSRESDSVVRTMKVNPVGRSKSRESNPVVRTVSYTEILRRNKKYPSELVNRRP